MHIRSNHNCCYSKRLVRFDPEPEQPWSICLMEASIAVDYITQFALCNIFYRANCSSELHYTIENYYIIMRYCTSIEQSSP